MGGFLKPTDEAGKQFYQDFSDKGRVTMLNLLKFKDKADYSGLDSLKPANEITGKEAYQLYMDKTLVELKKIGSKVIFYGDSRNFLIGPKDETWDAVLLIEHQSLSKFLTFAQDKNYLKNAGHRTAALEDSRLLPINENMEIT